MTPRRQRRAVAAGFWPACALALAVLGARVALAAPSGRSGPPKAGAPSPPGPQGAPLAPPPGAEAPPAARPARGPAPAGAGKAPEPASGPTGASHPATSDDPYARASAGPQPGRLALARSLASDCSARGLVLLWLLAHDPTPEVALAAAEAAVARCPAESPEVCLSMLHYFDEAAKDAPAGALAREALAMRDPRGALASAPSTERLAWVQRLAAGLYGARPDAAGRRMLRLLAEDADPEVQQAAGAALMGLDR